MLTTLVIGIIAVVVAVVLLSSLSPLRWIPNDRVGVIEKRFSPTKGSIKSGFMALGGEAGYQPSVLRGGIHILNPFQYRVHTVSLVTIPQGNGITVVKDSIEGRRRLVNWGVWAWGGCRAGVGWVCCRRRAVVL